MIPFPKRIMPSFTARSPKYSVSYRPKSVSTHPFKILNPLSCREPLPSTAMIRSCLAMQISSPLQSCSLHCPFLYRKRLVSFGHLPSPRVGMRTWRYFSWNPPPQATEQGDHFVHLIRRQFLSHD